jgi:NAD(P)H-dependent FMN reductase
MTSLEHGGGGREDLVIGLELRSRHQRSPSARAPSDSARVFEDRPVAVMGASPGRLGTALSHVAWLPVLRALKLRPWWGPHLLVGGAAKVFDDAGNLIDQRVRAELGAFIAGFVEFAVGGRRTGEQA